MDERAPRGSREEHKYLSLATALPCDAFSGRPCAVLLSKSKRRRLRDRRVAIRHAETQRSSALNPLAAPFAPGCWRTTCNTDSCFIRKEVSLPKVELPEALLKKPRMTATPRSADALPETPSTTLLKSFTINQDIETECLVECAVQTDGIMVPFDKVEETIMRSNEKTRDKITTMYEGRIAEYEGRIAELFASYENSQKLTASYEEELTLLRREVGKLRQSLHGDG